MLIMTSRGCLMWFCPDEEYPWETADFSLEDLPIGIEGLTIIGGRAQKTCERLKDRGIGSKRRRKASAKLASKRDEAENDDETRDSAWIERFDRLRAENKISEATWKGLRELPKMLRTERVHVI